MEFQDRVDGAQQLASKLQDYSNKQDCVVLGIPRGGVVTANVIAQALKLPLDVIVVRKIGAPFNREMALGAVTQDGKVYLDRAGMRMAGVTQADLDLIIAAEIQEAERRAQIFHLKRGAMNLAGKIAIIVDDGIATGQTMTAAVAYARQQGARFIVVAAPVIAREALVMLRRPGIIVVCVQSPERFDAIGQFYRIFNQIEDEQVEAILRK